jgi:hypothetical protein
VIVNRNTVAHVRMSFFPSFLYFAPVKCTLQRRQADATSVGDFPVPIYIYIYIYIYIFNQNNGKRATKGSFATFGRD